MSVALYIRDEHQFFYQDEQFKMYLHGMPVPYAGRRTLIGPNPVRVHCHFGAFAYYDCLKEALQDDGSLRIGDLIFFGVELEPVDFADADPYHCDLRYRAVDYQPLMRFSASTQPTRI